MCQIRFWNEADEVVSVAGGYIHLIRKDIARAYIKKCKAEAKAKGCVCVDIDNHFIKL